MRTRAEVTNGKTRAEAMREASVGVQKEPVLERSSTPDEAKKKTIAELSSQLKDELKFPTSARKGGHVIPKGRALRPDLEAIVETIFVEDMKTTWDAIKKSLRVGEKRNEHGVLHAGLDDARSLSYDAARLYNTAKRELDAWEADNAVSHGAMWEAAERSLQEEKDQKHRNKTITDADVKARAAIMFPDEWSAQEKKRRATKLTCDVLEKLMEAASGRCNDLQTMINKQRG